MTKVRAFSIHFAVSLVIFVGLAYLVVAVWYPGIFFDSDGGWQGMRIIVGVDLVLGPLLTLIVYKKGKPGLRFDLSLIGLVQSICLVAGTWVVYSERPISMVFVDGHFFSMNAKAYQDAGAQVPDLDKFPGQYPKWVQVTLPKDEIESGIIRSDIFREGKPLRVASQYYEPFKADESFLEQSADPAEITFRDKESNILPGWLQDKKGKVEDYYFYPFGARYQYVYFAFDAQGNKTGILPVKGPV